MCCSRKKFSMTAPSRLSSSSVGLDGEGGSSKTPVAYNGMIGQEVVEGVLVFPRLLLGSVLVTESDQVTVLVFFTAVLEAGFLEAFLLMKLSLLGGGGVKIRTLGRPSGIEAGTVSEFRRSDSPFCIPAK